MMLHDLGTECYIVTGLHKKNPNLPDTPTYATYQINTNDPHKALEVAGKFGFVRIDNLRLTRTETSVVTLGKD